MIGYMDLLDGAFRRYSSIPELERDLRYNDPGLRYNLGVDADTCIAILRAVKDELDASIFSEERSFEIEMGYVGVSFDDTLSRGWPAIRIEWKGPGITFPLCFAIVPGKQVVASPVSGLSFHLDSPVVREVPGLATSMSEIFEVCKIYAQFIDILLEYENMGNNASLLIRGTWIRESYGFEEEFGIEENLEEEFRLWASDRGSQSPDVNTIGFACPAGELFGYSSNDVVAKVDVRSKKDEKYINIYCMNGQIDWRSSTLAGSKWIEDYSPVSIPPVPGKIPVLARAVVGLWSHDLAAVIGKATGVMERYARGLLEEIGEFIDAQTQPGNALIPDEVRDLKEFKRRYKL